MYLKRIEIFGFKSFADRTELEFVPGVTAVVGPNGSGKSNVSDSVRWVLGEQSAKSLRGVKMEDVIFAGSDSRKPVNYGEVSLTLDNTDASLDLDYSEVSVTRRVYRSGESEYLINKRTCRLKDITELFMDTGLGKEAYSIIGQGRIEEILSTKSEDRRGILEEAAGVVKYKSRKKDAVRKLEETESNLLRILDIMAEIENQLEPLREQSEKAKQYKQLKKELTSKEISSYVYMIETLHQQWEDITQTVKQIKQEEEQLSFQLNQEDVRLEKSKWNLNQVEEMLESLQEQLLSLTEELEKLEGQREVLRERKRNYSTNKKDVMAKLDALTTRKDDLNKELTTELNKLEQMKIKVEQTEKQLAQEVQLFEELVPDIEEKIEYVKGDYIELLNKQASTKNEIRHLEQALEQYNHKLMKLEEENKRFVLERENVTKEMESQESLMEKTNKNINNLRESYKHSAQERQKYAQQLKQREEKLRHYESQLEKIINRHRFLQEMKEDFAGFFQGVKEVLKARGTVLKGINGAVAELIQVPKEYQVALETALGASLQHVVVEHEEAGRNAIHFLKQKNLGRATFLPKNVIRSKDLSSTDKSILQKVDGFIGIARQLIKFDQEYEQLIGNLLGHVIITTDLKVANQLAKQLNFRYRFVTLDGDIVNPGGSMTGGSVKQNTSNILGRENEIEQLGKEIEKGKQATAELSIEVEKDKEHIQDLDQQLEEWQQEVETLKEVESQQKEKLTQLNFAKQRLDERLEIYDQEVGTFHVERNEAEKKKNVCELDLATFSLQSKEIEEKIIQLEHKKKETAASKQEKNEQITLFKVALARKVQEYEEMKRTVERLGQSKKEIEQEWSDTNNHLLSLMGDLDQQDDQGTVLDTSIEQKKAEKEGLNQQIDELKNGRRKEQHHMEALEIKLKQLRREHKQLEETIHQNEVKANRLDVELENYLSLLREDYELSFELAKERYPLEGSFETVKTEVEQLKQRIQQLGDVHLGSIEEYERLLERYHFLQAQEKDLQKAKASLYEMINEMDEIMIERFRETYEAVRTEFHHVFQQLFGGGRADMILTNPDDLLTTGIDIIAQPPGKKLQHLGLLSGGERALTAIGILFAILKVKPVPFCILDEVEAALDEANVSRFAHYLKEFSKQTQFIVITHRKGTMEGADVLYGITMQESGVSKLVSVKLEEKEEIISA